MAKGITINKENFKHVYRKIVQRNISDKELRNRLSELGKQCTPSKLKDFSDVDREMVVELKDIYNILQKKHPQSIVGTSEYYELMSKTKKYEKGGSIDFDAKEFTISDLKKKVKELFPDSFGISLFYPDKTKSINDISPDLKQGYYGIDEKSLNGKFYFPQYSVDHFINFKITQGDENTYFDFIIQKESGDLLIAHFGFKDYQAGPEAISDFIQFLLNSYGAPKGTKYQYGGKTYYAKGGNIYTSDTMYVAKVYTFPNNVLKLEKNIRAKDVKQVNQIIEDDYMDTWKNKYGNDLHVIVEEAPDLTKKAKGGNVDLDAEIKAKRPGYRIPGSNKVPSKAEIKAGKAYYENRFNRSDDNRRTYPYLEKGGVINIEERKVVGGVDGNDQFEWLVLEYDDARKLFDLGVQVYEIFEINDTDEENVYGESLVMDEDDFDESATYAVIPSDIEEMRGFELSENTIKYTEGGKHSIFTGEVGLPYNTTIDGVEYIGVNYNAAVELLEGMEINLYLINEDEQVIDVEYKEDLNEDGIIVIKAEDINKLAKGGNVDLDAQIKAKRPGYRIPGTNKVPSKAEIKSGEAYYENRFNRSDDNRRTYPYLEKGGQLVTSKTLKGLDFSKIKFPANNSVKRVFHHSINPKLKSLQNDRYTGYTENSYTYGPMGNHKQSSLMRFIDRSKLNLATEKQVWGLKSGADWDELLVLADKKGYDGVAYKVYGDNAYILFDNSNAMLPETYVANLYNESKSKNQNNAFVNQIDSMLSANQKFERGGDISSSVAQIAYYTGLNAKAIREFAQKHDISSEGLDKIAKGLKKKEILFMDVTTAVVGKPDNKYQRQIIKYAKGTNNKMAMGGSVPSSLIKSNKHRND